MTQTTAVLQVPPETLDAFQFEQEKQRRLHEELVADGSDEARAYDVAAFVPGRGHREARVDEPEAADDEREFRRAVHALLRQRGEELRARAAEVVVVARE